MRPNRTPRPARTRALAFIVTAFALAALAAGAAPGATAASTCGPDGTQPGGAVYRVCMPDPGHWNGDLVIWAHGYVDATRPVAIPEDQLCLDQGFCLPDIINGLGFGFATTSYRTNGLVLTGVEDVAELVDLFAAEQGQPRRVYLVGASEGGLVTALGLEQRPDLFVGGVSACGPIGDFRRIVDYYGDFRVVFDYFFPGLMPGTPFSVPPDFLANWDEYWTNTIRPAIYDPANQGALSQLLKVTRAPHDPGYMPTIETTVHDALWYNVFATADLVAKLGGSPYDNMTRRYYGSWNDTALNAAVARYAADPGALAVVDDLLQTSGVLRVPMVNLHTTKDQQVAFAQELLYARKLRDNGSAGWWFLIPSFRYEHCNFKPWEAMLAFGIVVYRTAGAVLPGAEALLPTEADRLAYREAAARAGLPADPLAGAGAASSATSGTSGGVSSGGACPVRSLDSL